MDFPMFGTLLHRDERVFDASLLFEYKKHFRNTSGTTLGTLLHRGAQIFLILGVVLLVGCGKVDSIGFDGTKAFSETEAVVAIRPRDAGTGGARRAAVHLEKKLAELGYKSTIDTFSEETPSGKMFFNNVLGRLPGKTKRLIVIGSHFDTKEGISPDFQGANDSGSSTGVLLELARVLSEKGPLETEFLIAFFDGEELNAIAGETAVRQGLAIHKENRVFEIDYDKEGVWAMVEDEDISSMPLEIEIRVTGENEISFSSCF